MMFPNNNVILTSGLEKEVFFALNFFVKKLRHIQFKYFVFCMVMVLVLAMQIFVLPPTAVFENL